MYSFLHVGAGGTGCAQEEGGRHYLLAEGENKMLCQGLSSWCHTVEPLRRVAGPLNLIDLSETKRTKTEKSTKKYVQQMFVCSLCQAIFYCKCSEGSRLSLDFLFLFFSSLVFNLKNKKHGRKQRYMPT